MSTFENSGQGQGQGLGQGLGQGTEGVQVPRTEPFYDDPTDILEKDEEASKEAPWDNTNTRHDIEAERKRDVEMQATPMRSRTTQQTPKSRSPRQVHFDEGIGATRLFDDHNTNTADLMNNLGSTGSATRNPDNETQHYDPNRIVGGTASFQFGVQPQSTHPVPTPLQAHPHPVQPPPRVRQSGRVGWRLSSRPTTTATFPTTTTTNRKK